MKGRKVRTWRFVRGEVRFIVRFMFAYHTLFSAHFNFFSKIPLSIRMGLRPVSSANEK
jgi:hypothetical protein